jgi:O-antigen ligase
MTAGACWPELESNTRKLVRQYTMALRGRTYLTEQHFVYAILAVMVMLLPLGLLTKFPLIPFAIIVGVVWIFVTFKYPFVAMLMYASFILIRPHEWVPGMSFPMIEKAIVLPILIEMTLRFTRRRKKGIVLNQLDVAVSAFVLVTFLSIITSVWIDGAWKFFQFYVKLLIVYYMIAWNLQSEKSIRVFIYFWVLTSGFQASASVVNYYRGIRSFKMGIDRAIGLGSTYADPNSLAATVVYTLPFLYLYFKSSKNPFTRALFVGITMVSLWCVILTGSRTGMVGVIFFAFMIIWTHRNRLVALVIGAVVLVLTFAVMPDQYRQRLESTTDFSSSSGAALSAQGRIDGLVNGIRMMIDRPLFGVGVGQYSTALGMIYGLGWWEAHSLPGQLFGDLGLMGILAFTFWMYMLFRALGYLKDYYAQSGTADKFWYNMVMALQLQLLLLFFMGLGGHNLYRYNWLMISALTVALVRIVLRHKEERAEIAPEAVKEQVAQNEII